MAKHGNYHDKAKFMEGAAWMTEKIGQAITHLTTRESTLLDEFEQ